MLPVVWEQKLPVSPVIAALLKGLNIYLFTLEIIEALFLLILYTVYFL